MFTLQEINEQVDLYNTCSHESLVPHFDKIIPTNKKRIDAYVDYKDLMKNKYIIYISKSLYSYDKRKQLATLWHEFTHVADYYKFSNKVDDIRYILKTYSEAHATAIELMHLAHPSNETLYWYNEEYVSIIRIAKSFFLQSSSACLEYIETKHPIAFDKMITKFCYFCGCLMLYGTKNEAFRQIISEYPSQFIEEMDALGTAILNNDIKTASTTYERFYKQQKQNSIMSFSNKKSNQ